MDEKGDGIHHIGFYVEDIDKEVKVMQDKGYRVIQKGWRPTAGGYAYFNTEESCGINAVIDTKSININALDRAIITLSTS